MCKAWEDMMQEVAERTAREAAKQAAKQVEQAEERTILQNLRNMMEVLHLSAEQAMAALKIPEMRQADLLAKL